MIVTPSIFGRLTALIVLAVVFQLSFLSELRIAGTQPDILPVLVVALGLLGGSVMGAGAGFSVGLLIDLLLVHTLGASSLVYIAVGYLAGRIREVYDVRASSLTPPLVAGSLTLVAVTGFAVLQFLLGFDAQVSALVIRDMLVKSILAIFLMVPVLALTRRLVRPALIDEQPRVRRRSRRHLGFGRA